MSIVIVTGAGSGIGRAAAMLFAADGASVVAADIDQSAANETAKLVVAEGHGDAIGVRVDVADDASVGALVAAAVERFGRLDAAFNNAGISPAPKPFTDHSVAEWQRVIDVNLTGVFLCMQHEIRQFVAQGDGG